MYQEKHYTALYYICHYTYLNKVIQFFSKITFSQFARLFFIGVFLAFLNVFKRSARKRTTLAEGHVVPDAARCVQCGICTYNCPIEIDVRAHVWRSEAINRSECLTCGECVARCPRGVLRFERTDLFAAEAS
ncbi:MAG TPA: hypothetical protein DCY14_17490 [Anaerolineae bacterium]|nr:hypothetical protein [Anaerolineae bacterium]